jgi:hypothetical protein
VDAAAQEDSMEKPDQPVIEAKEVVMEIQDQPVYKD